MQTPSKKYVVDIWSDYVCPWCWIAKRRFENALHRSGIQDDVQINVHAYRLAAKHVPEPMIPALRRKLGHAGHADAMMGTVISYARADGLRYRFETMMFGDTADAHMLVKAVGDTAVKERLVEALYEQSTSHGRSIFDRSSLQAIAREVGVSDELIQLAWSSPELRVEMEEDEAFAAQLGSGVPLFVFGNAFSLSGAQPDAAFLYALKKMAANADSEDSLVTGQVCGIDGCKI